MTTNASPDSWRDRTSQRQAAMRSTAHRLVLAELRRRGDSLIAGAAEDLADRWAPRLDNARPDLVAEHVSRWLTDANVVRLAGNPAHEPEPGRSPLRVVLDRHAADLREGSVDALTAAWSSEALALDPHQLAGFVSRRLAGPSARPFLIEVASKP